MEVKQGSGKAHKEIETNNTSYENKDFVTAIQPSKDISLLSNSIVVSIEMGKSFADMPRAVILIGIFLIMGPLNNMVDAEMKVANLIAQNSREWDVEPAKETQCKGIIPIVNDIRYFVNQLNAKGFQWCNRDAKKLAHHVAQPLSTTELPPSWVSCPPPLIKLCLDWDCPPHFSSFTRIL
ncbi:hypothetical protein RJT34_11587 [Clitoria ternatea]|uniref:Uncharacterized protein n=1 Tax=Clitoria ternatea TaxID=43366 RepID=A0AAN9PJT2_CLITE